MNCFCLPRSQKIKHVPTGHCLTWFPVKFVEKDLLFYPLYFFAIWWATLTCLREKKKKKEKKKISRENFNIWKFSRASTHLCAYVGIQYSKIRTSKFSYVEVWTWKNFQKKKMIKKKPFPRSTVLHKIMS